MSKGGLTRLALAVVALTVTGCTLNRPEDPVVLNGSQLPALSSVSAGDVVAFRYLQGSEPDVGAGLVPWFRTLGRITARLHRHAAALTSTVARRQPHERGTRKVNGRPDSAISRVLSPAAKTGPTSASRGASRCGAGRCTGSGETNGSPARLATDVGALRGTFSGRE